MVRRRCLCNEWIEVVALESLVQMHSYAILVTIYSALLPDLHASDCEAQ